MCGACGSGLTCCGGSRVDLLSGDANCSACGFNCSTVTSDGVVPPNCTHGNCCGDGACHCSPSGYACDSQTCCAPIGDAYCNADGACHISGT